MVIHRMSMQRDRPSGIWTPFRTADGTAPTDEILIRTSECNRLGIGADIEAFVTSKAPGSDVELQIVAEMREYKRRRTRTTYVAVDEPALVGRIPMRKRWLKSESYGKRFFVGIAVPEETSREIQPLGVEDAVNETFEVDTGSAVEVDPVAAAADRELGGIEVFCNFLGQAVVEKEGGKLTADRIWSVWLEFHPDASPADKEVGGILRLAVPENLHYVIDDLPNGVTKWVDGKPQRTWFDYVVLSREEILRRLDSLEVSREDEATEKTE